MHQYVINLRDIVGAPRRDGAHYIRLEKCEAGLHLEVVKYDGPDGEGECELVVEGLITNDSMQIIKNALNPWLK